jgi:PAS domain S-box-containing protein
MKTVMTQVNDPDLFKALLEQALDCVFLAQFDDAQIIFMNRASRDILGSADELLLQLTLFAWCAPDWLAHLETALAHARAGETWRGVLTWQHRDGSTFPGELTCFVLQDHKADALLLAGFIRDVTAQMQMQEALHQSTKSWIICSRLPAWGVGIFISQPGHCTGLMRYFVLWAFSHRRLCPLTNCLCKMSVLSALMHPSINIAESSPN